MRVNFLRALVFLFALAGGFASISSAGAATLEVIPSQSSDPDIIAIFGDIQAGDETKFADIAVRKKSALVLLYSYGGAVLPAIEIGRTIRIKGFVTYVADGSTCASSCALIWLAGRVRSMGSSAKIGFHAAYTLSQGLATVNGPANALVGAYLTQLGLPDAAIIYVTSAPPTGVRWLSTADAKKFGLDVDIFDVPAKAAAPKLGENVSRSLGDRNEASLRRSPPEERARQFVEEFLALDAAKEKKSLKDFADRYAEYVFYYGNYRSRALIVKDHTQFALTWPERTHSIKVGSFRVECHDNGATCDTSALINWTVQSEKRNAKTAGASILSIKLQKISNTFEITAINAKVMDRHVSALHPNIIGCLLSRC